MIYGNGGAGLLIAGWDAFIIDNWFTSNRNGGIRSGGYVASITATGNRVESVSYTHLAALLLITTVPAQTPKQVLQELRQSR